MNADQRHRVLDQCDGSKRILVTNARILTQGVNVPAVDLVVFSDPQRSPTLIVQAMARAARCAPGKEVGSAMLPLRLSEGLEDDFEAEQDGEDGEEGEAFTERPGKDHTVVGGLNREGRQRDAYARRNFDTLREVRSHR